MPYELDLTRITIDEYRGILKKIELLPSREILHENLESAFKAIKSDGIGNLLQLKKALSTPDSMSNLSERAQLPMSYLTLMRREIGSYEPKKVRLAEYPGITFDTLQAMRQHGLMTSKDFYDFCKEEGSHMTSALKLALSLDEIKLLCGLSNLVRINGVGVLAAKCFYEAGYHCVKSIAEADAEEMLCRVNDINCDKQYYKANLRLSDIRNFIEFAKLLIRFDAPLF